MKLNTARQAQCVKTVRLLRVFVFLFGKGFVSIRAVPSVSTTLRNADGVLSHDRAILAACKTYRCAFLDTLSPMHTPPPPLTRDVRPVHIYIHTVGESECILATTSHDTRGRPRLCVLAYAAATTPCQTSWLMQSQLLARLRSNHRCRLQSPARKSGLVKMVSALVKRCLFKTRYGRASLGASPSSRTSIALVSLRSNATTKTRHARAVMFVSAMQAPLSKPQVAPPNDACQLLAA